MPDIYRLFAPSSARLGRSRRGLPSILAFVLLLLGWSNAALAQPRIVQVAQGVGTLNDAIDGDTTATGDRVDLNTVYELERGGIYILSGSVENRFPLTIVAAEGEGERPRLIPGVDDGGNSSRAFRARDDLTLQGLYVTNEDELGGVNTRIIRISADSARIVLDDCHLDKDGQSGFRLDNDFISIFISNSIISNIGTTGDPNNGRGIDDRGNPIDSLVVVNTTWYNLTSRVLRDDGGLINFARFDHNTMVNIGQFIVSFGEVAKARFTNNLVINGSFLGSNPTEQDGIDIDSLLDMSMTQSVTIRNNNFYLDPNIVTAYPIDDSVGVVPVFDATAQAFVDETGTGASNTAEEIVFTNGPASPADVVTEFYTNPGVEPPPMDDGLPGGASRTDPAVDVSPFDFSYSPSDASFAASTQGQPLGDLNWHGLDIIPTANAASAEVPGSFRLHGNYPNPFNPTTTIAFDLPAPAEVRVAVFDLLGRQVMVLPARAMDVGPAQTVRIEAASLASGVYLYQIQARTTTELLITTGRMVLMK